MKKIYIVMMALLSISGISFGQAGLEDIIVETFYIADANDATADEPLIEGAVTYRVYVDMAPDWEFQALYGENSPSTNQIDVLRIESTEPFFNNEDRGETFGYNIGTNRIDDGTVMVDSYLTAGRSSEETEGVLKPEDTDGAIQNGDGFLQNDDPLAGIPISQQDGNISTTSSITFTPTPGFEAILEGIFGEDDQAGSSLVTNNAALGLTESLVGPTAENKVLIGQFTTHGDFSFELNIQLRNTVTNEIQQWVAQTPQPGQFTLPSLTFPAPVNVAPSATFSASPISGVVPLDVSFDASASSDEDGQIVSYDWDFGNGMTGTGVMTNMTYTMTGSYTVTLTVTDDDGATATASTVITVEEPANIAPTASFTATPTTGVAPLNVNVDANGSTDSDGTIVSYDWDFGNGMMGTGITASTTYSTAGTYTITLTVTDDDGATSNLSATITVTDPIPNVAPTAAFSAAPTAGSAPLVVNFNGSSSSDSDGDIVSYDWTFGDGGTFSAITPTANHTYQNPGTYTVTLTVTDDDGATDMVSQTITVAPSSEEGLEGIICETYYIADANDEAGANGVAEGSVTYRVYVDMADDWEFQAIYGETNPIDGKIDTLKIESTEPFYNNEDRGEVFGYNIGLNRLSEGTVALDSYLSAGRTSETTAGILKVDDTDGAIANVSGLLQNDDVEAGIPISQQDGNIPTDSEVTYSATPGFESVLDAIFGSSDLAGSSLVTANAALGLTEELQGPTADNRVLIGQFTTNGDFSYALNVQLRNTITGEVQQWVASTPQADQFSMPSLTKVVVEVPNIAPVASFTADPTMGIAPLNVNFDASASNDEDGTIVSYSWDFGNGMTGTGVTTSMMYPNPGTYTVTLTVTDDDGATSTTVEVITVEEEVVNMAPVASFTADPMMGNAPLNVNFDASASNDEDGTIVSYSWDFGNGMTGTGVTTSMMYPNPGTYTVTLTVTDDDGATATDTKTITVEEEQMGGTARVQFIHNAVFETIDIIVNGMTVATQAYLTATPYIDVPAGSVTLELVPTNFWTTASPVTLNVNLTANETQVVTLYGTFDDSDNTPVEAAVFTGTSETSPDDEVGLLFFHGSPDAPAVDILANGGLLYDDVSYGNYNDEYLTVDATSYELAVTPADDNSNILREYDFPIEFWKRRSAVIFATGNLADNTFQPWVALSLGGTYPLNEISTFAAMRDRKTGKRIATTKNSVLVSPNPAVNYFRTAVYLDSKEKVLLGLYDVHGNELAPIFNGELSAGFQEFRVAVDHLPSGMYFVRMISSEGVQAKAVSIVD